MSYNDEFLTLKAAGDILNIVGPMSKGEKEISEAWSMVKRLKKIALRRPMKYDLVDFCSGNALVPLTSAFVLPFRTCTAVDKRPNKNPFSKQNDVRRFQYIDIDLVNYTEFDNPTVLTSVHCCGELANKVIETFKKYDNIRHLLLMPCCRGDTSSFKIPSFVKDKLGKYITWSYYLATLAGGNVVEDRNILSPCRCIVHAEKT